VQKGQKQRPTTAKRCSSGTGRPVFIVIGRTAFASEGAAGEIFIVVGA
jgi:hypothetical protein